LIHWVATLVVNSWKQYLGNIGMVVYIWASECLSKCENSNYFGILKKYGAVQVALLRDRVLVEVRIQQKLQHLQGIMQPLLQTSVLGVENALK